MIIGEKIKEIRKSKKMSQSALAGREWYDRGWYGHRKWSCHCYQSFERECCREQGHNRGDAKPPVSVTKGILTQNF